MNTMPGSTLAAFADHGAVPATRVQDTYAAATDVFDELARLGIDYHDVVATLEREGVRKFADSWDELGKTVGDQLNQVAAGCWARRPAWLAGREAPLTAVPGDRARSSGPGRAASPFLGSGR